MYSVGTEPEECAFVSSSPSLASQALSVSVRPACYVQPWLLLHAAPPSTTDHGSHPQMVLRRPGCVCMNPDTTPREGSPQGRSTNLHVTAKCQMRIHTKATGELGSAGVWGSDTRAQPGDGCGKRQQGARASANRDSLHGRASSIGKAPPSPRIESWGTLG